MTAEEARKMSRTVWYVEKRMTAIKNLQEAYKVYEGITIDPDANGYDTTPCETHVFLKKEDAIRFLNQHANYYFYSKGRGVLEEWTAHEEQVNEYGGFCGPGAIDYYFPAKSNYTEFLDSLEAYKG